MESNNNIIQSSIKKEKNLSIELMKLLAVALVINSHADKLYGSYSALATGRAIGNAIFSSFQVLHCFLDVLEDLIIGIKDA